MSPALPGELLAAADSPNVPLELLERHPLRLKHGCEAVQLHRGARSWAAMTVNEGIIGMHESREEAMRNAIMSVLKNEDVALLLKQHQNSQQKHSNKSPIVLTNSNKRRHDLANKPPPVHVLLLALPNPRPIPTFNNSSIESCSNMMIMRKSPTIPNSNKTTCTFLDKSTQPVLKHHLLLPIAGQPWSLDMLRPVKRKLATSSSTLEIIEVLDDHSMQVLVCFRGMEDASHALGFTTQVLQKAMTDSSSTPLLGGYKIQYGTSVQAYEYGAHTIDYKCNLDETHGVRLLRFQVAFAKDVKKKAKNVNLTVDAPLHYDTTCMICQTETVQVVFEPCHHCVLCVACARNGCRTFCPQCRTPITKRSKRFSGL